MGLDCEWVQGMVGSNIDVIQLCVGEEGKEDIVLIRTNLLKKCPPSLLQLLSIRGLHIGGNRVQSDLTRLSKHFKELQGLSRTLELQYVCDLSRMAVERGVTVYGKGENTLQNICRRVLGKYLHKTGARDSDWRRPSLSKEQIQYAALDALASFRVLKALLKMTDLTIPLSMEEAQPGVKVDICPLEGSHSCRAASAGKAVIVSEPIVLPSLPPGLIGPRPPMRQNKTCGGPQAWVEVTHVSQRALKVPYYSTPDRQNVCLGQLASIERTAIRLPLSMLRKDRDGVGLERRVLDTQTSSSTDRSAIFIQRSKLRKQLAYEVDSDSDNDDVNGELEQDAYGDSDKPEKCVDDIKDWELEKLRAVKNEYKKTNDHPKLAPPPPHYVPRYSAVLGDGFHYMDRQEMSRVVWCSVVLL
jgi:hypothetical protein